MSHLLIAFLFMICFVRFMDNWTFNLNVKTAVIDIIIVVVIMITVNMNFFPYDPDLYQYWCWLMIVIKYHFLFWDHHSYFFLFSDWNQYRWSLIGWSTHLYLLLFQISDVTSRNASPLTICELMWYRWKSVMERRKERSAEARNRLDVKATSDLSNASNYYRFRQFLQGQKQSSKNANYSNQVKICCCWITSELLSSFDTKESKKKKKPCGILVLWSWRVKAIRTCVWDFLVWSLHRHSVTLMNFTWSDWVTAQQAPRSGYSIVDSIRL